MRFRDRVAVITGAGRGIGQATALRFAEEGATVAVLDIRPDGAEETVQLVQQNGGRGVAVVADVTRSDDVERSIQVILDRLGRIDILFNNAGTAIPGKVTAVDEATWDTVIAVNLRSTFLMCRYAIPAMISSGGGAIVNAGSITGLAADYGNAAYSAAKAGIINLTRSIALDYVDQGIRCNCICPGATDTPLVRKMFRTDEARRRFESAYPMKRHAKPSEIANAVLFLSSDEASFITGAVLCVDGGITAHTGQVLPWQVG